MQAADADLPDLPLETHSESPPPFIPPPPDHPPAAKNTKPEKLPTHCANCGKRTEWTGNRAGSIAFMRQKKNAPEGEKEPQVFCAPDCIPLDEFPRCVVKLLETVEKLAKEKARLDKEIERLDDDKEKLEQQVRELNHASETIVAAHHRKTHVIKRMQEVCESSVKEACESSQKKKICLNKKSKVCEQCMSAVSIATSVLPCGEDVTDLHEFSNVHPICIGEHSWAFCTTCRGRETAGSLTEWFAQNHAPTIRIVTNPAVGFEPLKLKFHEQPIAAQTNGLMQGD